MGGSYMLYELYEKFTNSWEEGFLAFIPPPIWESDLILETVIITREIYIYGIWRGHPSFTE